MQSRSKTERERDKERQRETKRQTEKHIFFSVCERERERERWKERRKERRKEANGLTDLQTYRAIGEIRHSSYSAAAVLRRASCAGKIKSINLTHIEIAEVSKDRQSECE